MNDQELRDKLALEEAKEWWLDMGPLVPDSHDLARLFKAGWNAARLNDEEKEDLKRTEKVYWMNREAIDQLKQERDQLKAQCEKLAEALLAITICSSRDDASYMASKALSK